MKSVFLAVSLFLAGLFGGHQTTNSFPTAPSTAAVVTFADNQPPTSPAPPVTSATFVSPSEPSVAAIARGAVLGTSTVSTDYVTQSQLAAQLSDLRSLIFSVAASSTSAFTNPQIAANGNGVYFGEVAAPVTQLSASVLTGLTAAEIPALNYFPATSTISIAYGGTGTSTRPAANRLLLSDALGNWEYVATSSLGISGGASLTGTRGQVAYFSGTNNAIGTSSLFIAPSGNVGIGTTSPWAQLSIQGVSDAPSPLFDIADSAGDQLFNIDNSGNVTIGNSGATTTLLGSINASGTVNIGIGNSVVFQNPNFNDSGAGISPTVGSINDGSDGGLNITGYSDPRGGSYPTEGSFSPLQFWAAATPIITDPLLDPEQPYWWVDFNKADFATGPTSPAIPGLAGDVLTSWHGDYNSPLFEVDAGPRVNYGFTGTFGFNLIHPQATIDARASDPALPVAILRKNPYESQQTADMLQVVDSNAVMGPTVFSGTGVNDGVFNDPNNDNGYMGYYDGANSETMCVKIVATGNPDTITWGVNASCDNVNQGDPVPITAGVTQWLGQGMNIDFDSATGHHVGDKWSISLTPATVISDISNNGGAYFASSVGVGTTSPYARLSVWGPDSASSTLAFNVVNSASTTVFAVFDGGNAQLSGTLTQSSDQRLKMNIQSLDASDTLALIDQLNPVTFNWKDPNQGSAPQLGFIAQQVQQVFPNLVSTTSATALTPDGTLGLNYIGLISPIVSAIQALSGEVQSLVAEVQGFAQSFVSNNITASQELCVGSTCVTPAQFQAMVAAYDATDNQSPSPAQQSPASTSNPPESETQNSASTTATIPPTITINGDNPAIIQVGASYADLGATVSDTGTGQAGDTNLGYHTFLNGTLVSNIVIDTSQVATDTTFYVATDTDGLTATSTRIVLIDAATAATSTQ